MQHLFKRVIMRLPFRVLVLSFVASLFVAATSVAMAHFWAVDPAQPVPTRLLVVCGVSNAIGFLALLAVENLMQSAWLNKNLLPFFDPLTRPVTWVAGAVSLFVTLLCLGFGWWMQGIGLLAVLRRALDNPNGIFALVTGVATIVGMWITLHSVLEFRQTITSFPELIEHVSELIQSTGTSEDQQEYVRFLAYTPIPGSLALDKRDWEKMASKLRLYANRVRAVCLKEDDLTAMHNLYLGRRTSQGTVSQGAIETVNGKVRSIIAALEAEHPVIRKSQLRMPRYYLFANDRRAIIALPAFLPLPIDGLKQEDIIDLPPVRMYGFATGDLEVVKHVHKMFDIYQDRVPND